MLKRLRSAHPMLYCLVAEVLFLGMLFVASLSSKSANKKDGYSATSQML